VTCSAIEASRTTRPDSELFDALNGGLFYGLVSGKTKVVVGGQVQAFFAVDNQVLPGLEKVKKLIASNVFVI
jgi:hypothetical protein